MMITKVQRKPYIYGKHFAPHDIEATDIGTGKTRMESAKKLGIKFTMVTEQTLEDGINAVPLFLDHLDVHKETNKEWIRSIKNYGREWDEKRGMYKDEPLHNWASHDADETRYAALSEKKMTNEGEFRPGPWHDAMDNVWSGNDPLISKNISTWP